MCKDTTFFYYCKIFYKKAVNGIVFVQNIIKF